MTRPDDATGAGDLVVRALEPDDADRIADMLGDQRQRYLRFFYAFGCDPETLRTQLSQRRRDVYSGMFVRGELFAIFTLRGWDDGYELPSFGIVVRESKRRYQLAATALEIGKLICRLAGTRRMMCKIHPDNVATMKLALRLGFERTGMEEGSGNAILHLDV